MSYHEIMMERNAKQAGRTRRGRKRPNSTSSPARNKRSRVTEECERGEREIEAWGLEDYCAVLQF